MCRSLGIHYAYTVPGVIHGEWLMRQENKEGRGWAGNKKCSLLATRQGGGVARNNSRSSRLCGDAPALACAGVAPCV